MNREELRTLKEIEVDFCSMKLINTKELREEAMKWIRYFEEVGDVNAIEIIKARDMDIGMETKDHLQQFIISKILFILEFFNIIEKDLENE